MEERLCRCCLAEGVLKDMLAVYSWKGTNEVYSDMLLECFNITIAPPYSEHVMICEDCIRRLRDAKQFKDTVTNALKNFNAALFKISHRIETESTYDTKIETEILIKQESDNEDYECNVFFTNTVKGNDTKDLSEDEIALDSLKLRLKKKQDLKPLPTKSILPRKSTLPKPIICDLKRLRKALEKSSKAETTTSRNGKPNLKRILLSSCDIFQNVVTLVECSNMTPFKTRFSRGYRCFYCTQSFEDPTELREHSNASHDESKKEHFKKILKRSSGEGLVVNVDINELKCKLCSMKLSDIKHLKTHLIEQHKKIIDLDSEERIIPFKLSVESNQCIICRTNFEAFLALERHMNTHFQNAICDVCGSGYATRRRLKSHVSESHMSGNYPCPNCKKVFTTNSKLRSHVDFVHHSKARFKCHHCSEKFHDYFRRQDHMVKEHNATPKQYKCNVCELAFPKKFSLTVHVRKFHLQERNYSCEICGYASFSRHELQNHLIKHTGNRIYECEVCKKSYARKKTLTEHMRIHNNDRRFACLVCGQTFVQKCSLKGHVKTHHSGYVMQ